MSQPVPTPSSGDPGELPLGELVSRLSEQVTALVKAELALAQAEIKQKGKRLGIGAGMFGAAGVLALYGVGALLFTVGLALDVALPAWLAGVIVTVAVFAAAGALALGGKKGVSAGSPPVPKRAVASVKADVAEIQHARSK